MTTPPHKIPCSVSIITRGRGLAPVLESLKDFEEIIICHGNPGEEYLAVARQYGAKLVRQYETDEPNLTCDTDKANVRQKAMDASTLPWRFFMDRDDRFSPEMVEEIRSIVTDPHPAHLIWRMPSYVVVGERLCKHYATYPAYQTRLVHESVHATFRGNVHERLVWDQHKFPAGTMRSHYIFNWPQERVDNFWKYQRTYINRELSVEDWSALTLGGFLYWWIYKRVRIIAGYVLWRLPSMYLRFGFKESMPLKLELYIVGYHLGLLFGGIKKFVSARLR